MTATDKRPSWPIGARLAFRFVFAYVLLFYLSFSAFFAPFSIPFALLSKAIWSVIVPWVSTAILKVPAPALVSDGDGLAQWIMFGGCFMMAVFATIVWTILDRSRSEYTKLQDWLMVIARYLLGIAMVTYGLAKIVHLQMLPPHLGKLVQPLGESSPTSLLWIFMGSSAAYSAFTGFVELLGGILLFVRRTTTLGALVSFGAMTQVVALNLAYDVSVKIWSMNLAALALVMLVPDLRRLMNVLVLNRSSEPADFRPLFSTARRNRLAFRIGMVCLVLTLGFRMFGMLNGRGSAYGRTPTPLWGIHEVSSFSSNGVEMPPLTTDAARWRRVVIERSGLASIRFMDDSVKDYLSSVDSAAATVTFVPNPDETVTAAGATRLAYDPNLIQSRFEEAMDAGVAEAFVMAYSQARNGDLHLSGQWRDSGVEVQTTRVDESAFLLQTRGFRWVQSYPYFR